MTDHFEAAKDAILRQARANGGVTTDHLLDALIATNEDLDEKLAEQRKEAIEKHDETKAWHDEVTGLLDKHIAESTVRDARLLDIEKRIHHDAETFEGRVVKAAGPHHEKFHTAYVAGIGSASSHRDGEIADYSDRRAPVTVEVENHAPLTYTREALVANFWWLVGGLIIVAVVGGFFGGLMDYVLTILGWK